MVCVVVENIAFTLIEVILGKNPATLIESQSLIEFGAPIPQLADEVASHHSRIVAYPETTRSPNLSHPRYHLMK